MEKSPVGTQQIQFVLWCFLISGGTKMYYMYRHDNTERRTNGAQDERKIELDIKKMGIR